MGNIERSWTIRNVDGGPLTVRQEIGAATRQRPAPRHQEMES